LQQHLTNINMSLKSIIIACLAANASANPVGIGIFRGRTLKVQTSNTDKELVICTNTCSATEIQCLNKCQSENSDLEAKDWYEKSSLCSSQCTTALLTCSSACTKASENRKLRGYPCVACRNLRGKTETQLAEKQFEADDVKVFIMEAAKTTGLSEAQVAAAVGEKRSNFSPSAKKIMDPEAQKKIALRLKAVGAAALAKAWHIDSNMKGFDEAEKKLISAIAVDMGEAFDSVAAHLTGLTTEAVHSTMQGLTLSNGKLVAIAKAKTDSTTTTTTTKDASETEAVQKLQSKLPAILSKLNTIKYESLAAAKSALSSKVQLANVLHGATE